MVLISYLACWVGIGLVFAYLEARGIPFVGAESRNDVAATDER